MKPDEKEIDALVKALSSRHGLTFDELVKQSKKLATYIKGLDSFRFVEPRKDWKGLVPGNGN